MGLHEILDPAVERRLSGWVVHLAVVIAWNGEDWRVIMSIGLIELSVIIVLLSGKVDDIADMVAKLRLTALGVRQMVNHLLGDIALEFASWTPPVSPTI